MSAMFHMIEGLVEFASK